MSRRPLTFLLAMSTKPSPYTPPPFAQRLSSIPTHRLRLAQTPTPIEPFPLRLAVPSLPDTLSLHIKRDDQTGCPTSGNKIRKLEFLLADALHKGATTVITAGGVQSNHARATAAAARRLGLDAHVFLRSPHPDKPDELAPDGNVLIHQLLGVNIHLVKPMPFETGLLPRMKKLKHSLEAKGENPYIIGIGGSNGVGLWGYVECFAEMVDQGVLDQFTHLVVPVGSGGTASGLAIGNYLCGGKLKVIAVSVCDDANYFYAHLDDMLANVGLAGETSARDIMRVVEAKGRGYSKNTEEELKLGVQVAMNTGVLLDPVYTLKGVFGMVGDVGAGIDSDARVLFVHTGGIFGLFDRRIEPFLKSERTRTWVDG